MLIEIQLSLCSVNIKKSITLRLLKQKPMYIILSHNETFMYALTSAKVGKKKDALQSVGFIRKWLRNFPQRRGDNGLVLCFAPAKMLYSAQICLLLGTETAMYSGSDLWILTVRAKMNIRSNSSSKKNKKWRDR